MQVAAAIEGRFQAGSSSFSGCLYAAFVGHGCQFRRLELNQRPSRFQRDALTV
jgi:hypothetical protein